MPYWRLSGFYFFYFASLGALVPYWGLYLKELQYSSQQIGVLLAMLMLTKIVSPIVWGWIADHSGKSMGIVRLGCLLALLCFSGVYIADTFWWLALVMMLFSFFWNATLPQFEVTTLNHLGEQSSRYAGVRLWGSIGFIVTVLLLGRILESEGALVLPGLILILFVGIWLMSLVVPEQTLDPVTRESNSLRAVLRKPGVISLLLVCFLMQLSHGPYYAFFSIYLEENGYSRSVIGQLWAVGVFAEVLVFLVMQVLTARFGLRVLLIASLLIASLRWVIIAYFVNSLPLLLIAQLCHAASFGIYHVVAIQLIHKNFTGKLQGRGQALYSSVSFGAGGAVGSFYSGMIWDQWGATTTYLLAAGAALLGAAICWRWIKPEKNLA